MKKKQTASNPKVLFSIFSERQQHCTNQVVYFPIFSKKDIMVLSSQVASPKRKHCVKPSNSLQNFLVNTSWFRPSSTVMKN